MTTAPDLGVPTAGASVPVIDPAGTPVPVVDPAGTPVPVVDIAPLLAEPDGAAEVVAAMDRAAIDIGFFAVVGHGLQPLLDDLFDVSQRFFALPQADKELVPRVDRYGFVPQQALAIDTERLSGRTEYLDLGLADEVALPALSGFEAAVRAYQAAAIDVARAILRGLARALGADPDFFADHMAHPQCRLRLLHYPPTPLLPDGTRSVAITPHTDYGAITLLATDGVPGLEVRPVQGAWTPVEVPPGAVVVNLGDMLARWTNDRYVSTPHRVVGSPDRHRFSIPFFVNPDPEVLVTVMAECVSDERPCAYEPVTAGAFLAMRIDSNAEPYVDPTEGPARAYTP